MLVVVTSIVFQIHRKHVLFFASAGIQ